MLPLTFPFFDSKLSNILHWNFLNVYFMIKGKFKKSFVVYGFWSKEQNARGGFSMKKGARLIPVNA